MSSVIAILGIYDVNNTTPYFGYSTLVALFYFRMVPYVENTKRKEERTDTDDNSVKDEKMHMP
jgi:hypothetical protein